MIYCSAYFCLLKIFSILYSGLQLKYKPSRKHTAIDLEIKLRMILKYEDGQNLSGIVHGVGFAISTVNTIVKDVAQIKECEWNDIDEVDDNSIYFTYGYVI
jgi:sugar lactone lactonase YvrE